MSKSYAAWVVNSLVVFKPRSDAVEPGRRRIVINEPLCTHNNEQTENHNDARVLAPAVTKDEPSASNYEPLICAICCDRNRSVVVMPCMHLVMCDICAQAWARSCPVCRVATTGRMTIIIP